MGQAALFSTAPSRRLQYAEVAVNAAPSSDAGVTLDERRMNGTDANCRRRQALRYVYAVLQGVDRRGTRQTKRPMVSALCQGTRLRHLFDAAG